MRNTYNTTDIDFAISVLTLHINLYHVGISRNRYADRVEYFKYSIKVATLTHDEVRTMLSDIDNLNRLVIDIDKKYNAAFVQNAS